MAFLCRSLFSTLEGKKIEELDHGSRLENVLLLDYMFWFHLFIRNKLHGIKFKNRWVQKHHVGKNRDSQTEKKKHN